MQVAPSAHFSSQVEPALHVVLHVAPGGHSTVQSALSQTALQPADVHRNVHSLCSLQVQSLPPPQSKAHLVPLLHFASHAPLAQVPGGVLQPHAPRVTGTLPSSQIASQPASSHSPSQTKPAATQTPHSGAPPPPPPAPTPEDALEEALGLGAPPTPAPPSPMAMPPVPPALVPLLA